MPGRPPILIVENDPRLCELIGLLLGGYSMRVTRTGAAALAAVEQAVPVLALVDLDLHEVDGEVDGIVVIAALRARWPGLPVLVVTAVSTPARVIAALHAGAQGYLFAEDLVRRLISAVEETLAGGVPLSAGAARSVLAWLRTTRAPRQPRPCPLTLRERTVVAQLARGLTQHAIGDVLNISEHTVRSHVRAAYEKLGVNNKGAAIAIAMRESWIGDPADGCPGPDATRPLVGPRPADPSVPGARPTHVT